MDNEPPLSAAPGAAASVAAASGATVSVAAASVAAVSGAAVSSRSGIDRAWRRAYAALLRPLFRATHPVGHRHSERLWPHARVQRDSEGRIAGFVVYGKTIPIENAATPWPATHTDAREPWHLIAAGPSIAAIDYDRLASAFARHHVMGVNGAIALGARLACFDHYCITDSGFIRQRPEWVAQILACDLVLYTSPLCLWQILQRFPLRGIRCRFHLIERVGLPALSAPMPARACAARAPQALTLFDSDRPQQALGFSHDPRYGVFPGGTVAYEALQIAVSLGAREVYLHGVDLGANAGAQRFYEHAGDSAPSSLPQCWADEIEPSFRHAAALLRRGGVRVVNLSKDSALDDTLFPKVDWRTLPFVDV